LAFLADARVALRGNGDLASTESIKRARELILENKKPGDLVVHSPLLSVRELSPLGNMAAGPDLPEPRLRKARRILVLDVQAQTMYGLGHPKQSIAIAGPRPLVLNIFEPKMEAKAQVFDLYTDLERAQMRIERPAGTVVSNCTAARPDGGRSCPGQPDWLYLNHRELVIDGEKRTCIWAHPTTGGVIVIELPGVEAPTPERSLWLKVTAGLTDDAVRGTADGAHVDTTIKQGNKILGRVRAANRVGTFDKEVQITPKKPVTLRITSPKDGRRHHCVNAQIEARQ